MDDASKSRFTRRQVCKAGIGSLTFVTVGTVGYPIITFLGQPVRVSANKPLEVPLAGLSAGQAQYAEFQGQQLIVLALDDGPRVFSAACTHLGCNVIWETSDGVFRCPCHGAIFDDQGAAVSGPVSTPLERVPFEIKDGTLIVSS